MKLKKLMYLVVAAALMAAGSTVRAADALRVGVELSLIHI